MEKGLLEHIKQYWVWGNAAESSTAYTILARFSWGYLGQIFQKVGL